MLHNSFIIISGISGAGRSSALHTLSDYGYTIVENLPFTLLKSFIDIVISDNERYQKTAIIVETISNDEVQKLKEFVSKKSTIESINPTLLFFDCATETILRRYSETRRPHPGFTPSKDRSLTDTIQRERSLLAPLKDIANFVIETSSTSIHDLRRKIKELISTINETFDTTTRINLISFGFKYGIPRDCDLVADIRFLPNPYYVHELREKTGKDQEVSNYVLGQVETNTFLDKYTDLLNFLLPRYANEGRPYITIGIGCTGGRHRSVAIAEKLSERLSKLKNFKISVQHRDVGK